MSTSSLRGQVRSGGWGSSLHSGIQCGRSRTGEGSLGGGRRGWCEEWPGAARTILLFHIISARPPKQPSFFSRSLGWRMHLGVEVTELSTNKQHHISPAFSSFTHACRMDGFCNQNADQLGYLARPSLLTVYVGVVELPLHILHTQVSR